MSHPCESLEKSPGADLAPAGVRPTDAFAEFTPGEVEQSIPDRFERQAARHAGRTAVLVEGQALTYAELDRWANRIARALLERRGPSAEPVGLLIGRAVPMVAAILGTLKAGKVYLPLEPRFPAARLRQVVAASGAGVVVCDGAHRQLAAQLAPGPGALLDVDRAAEQYPDTAPARSVGPDHVGYLLYTSGSTGRPKGVYQNHRNLLHHTRQHTQTFRIAPGDRVALLAPFSAAASIHPLLSALLNGAALCPFDAREQGADRLAGWLAARRITLYHSVPALFRQVAASLGPGPNLPHLRLIRLGGDQVLPGDVDLCRTHFAPGCALVVSFGASETHTVCWHRLDGQTPVPADVVPVGRAVDGAEVLLLDEAGEPVRAGEVGEIAVRSRHLALGYWNDPERTRASFGDADAHGRRTYRTGDLGRQLSDGCLVHLGRKDLRVKIRGQAVDLAEVEAALAALMPAGEAAVAVSPDRDGQPRLVGYVAPAAGGPVSPGALRTELARTLPDFMVPSAFVRLDALPRTGNGKVDRPALPPPGDAGLEPGRPYTAPRTPLEERLAGLWAEVLGLTRVGVHDDFFELGGHSLLGGRLLARVRSAFGVDLPLRRLFEAPTVAALAGAVTEARAAGPAGETAIPRRQAADPCPLSFAQQRLWFLDRLEPNRPLYNVWRAVRLRGDLNEGALRHALDALVARHETLRTTFALADGGPVQVIAASRSVPIATADLTDMPVVRREAEVRRRLWDEVRRPFDLKADAMLRAALFRLRPDEYVLLLVTHHVNSDRWSMTVLLRELAALYEAFAAGKPSPLPELPVQYADYALWERRRLAGEALAAQLAYWRGRLDGAPAVLHLPTTRTRPANPSFDGACRACVLPGRLVEALRALGRGAGATLYMVLLTAFKALLYRYTGQEDMVVGCLVAGRNRVEVEGLVGFFANTLALRSRLAGDLPLRELLGQVRETTLEALAHQGLPFERLVEELRPERSLGSTPLFQVMVVLQNAPRQALQLPGLAVEPVQVNNGTAKFDLTLVLVEEGRELRMLLEYRTDLFDQDAMDRLLGHYRTLLEGAVADPGRRLAELPLLTEGERHQLLIDWNRTEAAYPSGRRIHELFEEQVRRAPDAVAVASGGRRLSYGELNERANRLAHHLHSLSVGAGSVVAVCVERSPEMVVGLLGILKTGAAYVPLDPAYPPERLAFMLADSRAAALVTGAALAPRFAGQAAHVVCLDADGPAIARQPAEDPNVSPAADSPLAYVIYTSGSTGRPKGVEVPHAAVVNLLTSFRDQLRMTDRDVLLAVTTLSFDIAGLEIFLPLTTGACVWLADREAALSGTALQESLRRAGATFLQATPVTWRLLLDSGWPGDPRLTMLCGGEALPADLAERLRPRGASLWNLYGPTETTIWSTAYRVNCPHDPVPIGRPVANTQVYVLDRHLQPVPVGVPGELYIGGAGLARGYRNRPELTAEKFIPDPFRPKPGARLYRTGDRVRWLPDGNLEYLGRFDQQVKIRGHRVELGEIEATLARHPRVRQAVALLREDRPGDQRLVAYVVPRDGHRPGAEELRGFLEQKLPPHMIPNAFVGLEALPRTPNGKLDRKALPAPESTRPELAAGFDLPATPVEEQLAALWAELLGIDRVGVHDNFFDLGGHSLLAVELFARLEKQFHRRLPLAVLFRQGTVAELARLLAGPAGPARDVSVVELQAGGAGGQRPLFLIPSLGGELLFGRLLIRHLGKEIPVYGLQPRLVGDAVKRFGEFEPTAALYRQALQDHQPRGPYALAGFSYGGFLAYEVARQLRELGHEVDLLAVLDTGPGRRGLRPARGDFRRRWAAILRNLPSWIREDALWASPGDLWKRTHRHLRNLARRWLGRLRGVTPVLNLEDAFTDADRIPTQNRELMATIWRAFRAYVPQPYPGRVTLLRARTRSLFSTSGPDLGWGWFARGGVDVRIIPGHHGNILGEPHVRILARELKKALVAARPGQPGEA
jgi:amino acid adenylation domain-containing protein